ncbi:zinc ribbon domain-containing protein [Lysinibacillus sp. FSL M8-0216]|uniref:zinc-ribbon domain-containing protein n=1 Tax=Lysinibacillus TaxID=400634 RepID=UPI000D37EB40|nr:MULTISPECIES: zinc ribbon domain-containing protein [Lysinibacillus]MCG7434357.1 zinc ribbon domain-containing protein [Lysinibacillus fusiformis]MED4671515.1 zinc ribbon domain-containing protein [Lysinibacillus fusiformis]NOG27288.1 zinc ribbon domain-containing protein [Lysinibacillus fusiformis]QAS55043.1 zinc ribbon domain-containing protein [Lysinibacillus sphaericus]RDV33262.1 zinc ribbon domain-containing protein [Lysinibacillus fusiformis]
MYCPNCGSSINENAEICVHCGVNVLKFSGQVTTAKDDTPNIWINVLSLCCSPILGIIIYVVWKDSQPKAAKSALIYALFGIAISIIVLVISFVIGFAVEMMDDSYYY